MRRAPASAISATVSPGRASTLTAVTPPGRPPGSPRASAVRAHTRRPRRRVRRPAAGRSCPAGRGSPDVVVRPRRQREREVQPPRGLGRRSHPFGRVLHRVDLAVRVVIFNRPADRTGLGHPNDGQRGVLRPGPVPVLQIDGDRQRRRLVQRASVLDHLVQRGSTVRPAEREPKPELVLARAAKPSAASTLAEPASHGFGMTNTPNSCSARKVRAFCCWDGCTWYLRLHSAPPFAGRRTR
jgi:hypothetical protein